MKIRQRSVTTSMGFLASGNFKARISVYIPWLSCSMHERKHFAVNLSTTTPLYDAMPVLKSIGTTRALFVVSVTTHGRCLICESLMLCGIRYTALESHCIAVIIFWAHVFSFVTTLFRYILDLHSLQTKRLGVWLNSDTCMRFSHLRHVRMLSMSGIARISFVVCGVYAIYTTT